MDTSHCLVCQPNDPLVAAGNSYYTCPACVRKSGGGPKAPGTSANAAQKKMAAAAACPDQMRINLADVIALQPRT